MQRLVVKLTEYDALGRVARVSRPHYAGATPLWTTYSYDVLGRPTQETQPDASVSSTAYNGRSTTVTNARGQTRTTVKDSQGQVSSVTDAASQVLTFTYDPYGNLKTTTDPLGNVATLAYDLRGRKTQMIDPDMGTWTYQYNALGELTRQTDAKSQVTTLAYDKLGRMTQRAEPSLISNWYYDAYKGGGACAKGIGKLCQAESLNGYNRSFTYDSLGRTSTTTTTIGGTAYAASTTYDDNGRLATQSYPTGFAVKYVYSALGYLKEVRNNDASNALYWRADAMDAEGHLTRQTAGNNVVTDQTYDANTGRLAQSVATGPSAAAVLNVAYSYDSLGNLASRSDATAVGGTLIESFTYDSLNRLVSESRTGGGLTSPQTSAYRYNALGNLICKGEIGTCGPTTVNMNYGAVVTVNGVPRTLPHALASVTGTVNGVANPTYAYDANGNVISSAGRSLTYASFDLPSSITKGSTTLGYLYDADHERMQETAQRPCSASAPCVYDAGGTQQVLTSGTLTKITTYLNPGKGAGLFYEKEVINTTTTRHRHYVSAGGATIAVVTTGAVNETRYWHKDHLGSTRVVTNETGAVVERLAFEVFGKRRNANGALDALGVIVGVSTDRGFTGHEHLDEVGLIHMNGRIYDPAVGRFMQADPYIQAALNLQSYNRYTYALNNPLAYTDPSGYFNLFKSVQKAWKSVWHSEVGRIAVTVAVAWYVGPAAFNTGFWGVGGSVLTATGNATLGYATGLVAGSALAGASVTLLSTGSLNGWEKAALTAGIFHGIGDLGFSTGSAENVIAHAAGGCLSSAATGGNCGHGAVAGALGELGGHYGGPIGSIVAGGTASVIGGGKFANGAYTAAFGYLFNYCSHATTKCLGAWAKNIGKIGLGALGMFGGGALCTTVAGCALGSVGVITGAANVHEGADWVFNRDESTDGVNPIKRAITNAVPSANADYVDASIMLSRDRRRAPRARLERKAPILIST